MIKLFEPHISWRAFFYAMKVLLRGKQLAEGPMVKRFEKDFETIFKVKNVVAVNSCTSALHIAYILAGVERGDEVLTPVMTCVATNLPILHLGAEAKFVDIDASMNMDPKDLEKKITKRTRAIVFVCFGGSETNLPEVIKIARRYNIKVIVDAAQALRNGFQPVADYTCLSLQATKTLTSGDGGLLITKGRADYERARELRWFGYNRELKQKNGDTDIFEAGFKYHMNDISAAIGLGNLHSIKPILDRRDMLRETYRQNGYRAGPWFAIAYVEDRDGFILHMKDFGYEVGLHHYRNDKYTIFGGRKRMKFMDWAENKYILLPINNKMTADNVDEICTITNQWALNTDGH